MTNTAFKFLPAALLVLACHAPAALAQSAPGAAERLQANAVASLREGRFPEAYGRFIALADAGHAPAAEHALWMYRHGPSLFGNARPRLAFPGVATPAFDAGLRLARGPLTTEEAETPRRQGADVSACDVR